MADQDIPEVTLIFEDGDEEPSTQAGRTGGTYQQSAHPGNFSSVPPMERTTGTRHTGATSGRLGDIFYFSVMGRNMSGVTLLIALLVVAAAGAIITGMSRTMSIAGVTYAAALGTSSLVASAAVAFSLAFGTIGAIIIVGIWYAFLWRRGFDYHAQALLITMWSAWIITSIVSLICGIASGLFTLTGNTNFIVMALAYPAALTTAVTALDGVSWNRGLTLGVGALLTVAAAASFVYIGNVTIASAIGSIATGILAALLGVGVWTIVFEPRYRMQSMMREAAGRMFQGFRRQG